MTLRLPVTSIERYHLCDDSNQNPNVISCELTVSGVVNLDIATAALREIARRHPMCYARLRRGGLGRWHWNCDEAEIGNLKWEAISSGENLQAPRIIDPKTGFPTRFLMRPVDDCTHLEFRTHHAAMDGGGGLQFVSDWLLTYHRISTGRDKPRSRSTDISALHRRNHLRLLTRGFLAKLWIQPIAVFGASKFLFRRVQPVTPPATGPESDTTDMDFQVLSHRLLKDEVVNLRNVAAESKATVNELILRAVFLGIHDFRKQSGWHREGEWLRLVIPMSIRDYADRRLPATNRATIVQLDRTDRDFADPATMVSGLNRELGCIRDWNLEKTFLLIMRGMALVPGLISRTARRDICRATTVVTNLGAPFERMKLDQIDGKLISGNLIVEDLGLIVPLRRQTPLGIALSRYRGEQKIDLHFDPLQIDRTQAEAVLKMIASRLI